MAGRIGRLRVYLAEMFPLPLHIPLAAVSFGSLYLLSQARGAALVVTPQALWGAAALLGLLLFLRVSDELKDVDADRALFPERAVARGAVTVPDLRALWWASLAAAGLCGALTGPWPGLAFAGVWVYALLMSAWFFAPRLIGGSLPLALLTHNPIVPALSLWVAAVAWGDGLLAGPERLCWLVPALWAPSLAWEVGRKVRAPEEETAYTTYSKIAGPRPPAIAVLLLELGSAAALIWDLGWERWPVWGGAAAGALAVAGVFGAFVASPTAARGRALRPAVELQLALSHLSLCLGLGLTQGMSWSGQGGW